MSDLINEVEVGGKTYVVQAIDAQTQYKILQKLARYGIAHLVAGMVKSNADDAGVKRAYLQTIVAVIQQMPEADQDFCISEALKKTAEKGKGEAISISNFCGRISEYVLLGARAIGVQLGDFSCFLNLIPGSTATAQEGIE